MGGERLTTLEDWLELGEPYIKLAGGIILALGFLNAGEGDLTGLPGYSCTITPGCGEY